MKFGAHVSIAGGLINAPLNAKEIGAETFQMFSRSPRGGKAPEITPDVITEFQANLKAAKIKSFYIHGPYYINLASKEDRIRLGSIQVLRDELERGSLIGATGMMFHVGSGKDFGKEKSTQLVIEGITKILDGYAGSCQLLIENSAGAGEILGDTFEEIGKIITGVNKGKNDIGVCLDTCHAFASGYELRNKEGIEETLKSFNKQIGLKKLKCLHLNDSVTEFGSHKDRHADLGYGMIGKKAFELIINHPKLKTVDALLETPEEKLSYTDTIKLLQKLRK